jgi:hypothetical protein
MPPPHLHVISIDPGHTTGWALFTVPRDSIFGDEPGSIIEWDYGEVSGDENIQVRDIVRLTRTIRGMDYPTCPLLVVEDFDIEEEIRTTDTEVLLSPVRIAAKLELARALGLLGESRVVLQSRTMAFRITDERLQRLGYYVEGSDHVRDAIRHGIMALRRVKENPSLRKIWWWDGHTDTLRPLFGERE